MWENRLIGCLNKQCNIQLRFIEITSNNKDNLKWYRQLDKVNDKLKI